MKKNKQKAPIEPKVQKTRIITDDGNSIRLEKVVFSYTQNEKKAVDNVTVSIKKGMYVCIIGHNGSGKSTLSKLITGILKPQSGEIFINGLKIERETLSRIRKDIGIVFQNPDNQFIGSTVEDDIAFGLENRQIPNEQMHDLVTKSADKVNMKDFLKLEPHNLSGGQKQRVAIAGILAINPPIIIFDESTSMLDPLGKRDIKNLILELKAENPDKTIISITHDMNEVINADWVIVMEAGKKVEEGKPKDIFTDREKIEKLKLDLPFINKISHLLADKGLKVKPTLDKDELLDQLCK